MYVSLHISKNIEKVQYGYILCKTHIVVLYLTWDTSPFNPRGDGEVIVDMKFHI